MTGLKSIIGELALSCNPDEYGRSYIYGLNRIFDTDDKALRVQAAYIANNCNPRTKEEKEAVKGLLEIAGVAEDDEILAERIMMSFERFTEGKVRGRNQIEEDISQLETAKVFRCDDSDDEFPITDEVCLVMDEYDKKNFEKYSDDVKARVVDFIEEGILIDFWSVCALDLSGLGDHKCYRHTEDVIDKCNETFEGGFGDNFDSWANCIVSETIKLHDMSDSLSGEGNYSFADPIQSALKARQKYGLQNDITELSKEDVDKKIAKMEKTLNDSTITMEDFKRFSEAYDYDVDDVLYYQGWLEDVLDSHVIAEISRVKQERRK